MADNNMIMDTTKSKDTASPVAQDKQGRVLALGRGASPISQQQSPRPGLPSGVTGLEQHSPMEVATTKDAESNTPGGSGGVAKHTEPQEGVSDAAPSAVGQGGHSNPAKVFLGVARQHESTVPAVQRSSKTNKRNARKQKLRAATSTNTGSDVTGTPGGSGAGTKRHRSDVSTPSPSAETAQKKLRKEPLPGGYSGAVKFTKLAIVRENFPTSKMSYEDHQAVQLAVMRTIDKVKAGDRLPIMAHHYLHKGTIC